MKTLEPLLRDHPFLQHLTDAHLRVIAPYAKLTRFEPGTFLFHRGDPADSLFLIRTGRVALQAHVPGRGATEVETLGSGDALGAAWLYPPYRWRLDALAVEPVSVIVFDALSLRGDMGHDPALGYAIARVLLERTHHRLEQMHLHQQFESSAIGA